MSGGTSPTGLPTDTDLPDVHHWSGRPTDDILKELPGTPAVYLLIDGEKRPVLLATTQHLRRLTQSRLANPEPPKEGKADLAAIVRGVRWRSVVSPFEARWWYYRLARRMYPKGYKKLISFGSAWFLNVDWSKPVAEPKISDRPYKGTGDFVGSWPSRRQCQEALDGVVDLFDLCRYPEQVRKSPDGQRCAYAEMGRCDAPCDGSVPLEAYLERVHSAWRFANGDVDTWIEDAKVRMAEAASKLEFERAGLLKSQIAFASRWKDRWLSRMRPLAEFNYLLAVPVTRRKAWKLFLLRQGVLEAGPILQDRKFMADTHRWLNARFGIVEEPPKAPEDAKPKKKKTKEDEKPPVTDIVESFGDGDATIQMEQVWLVSHLLSNRESDRVIIVPLRELHVPNDLGAFLTAALAEKRKRPVKKEGEMEPDDEVAFDMAGAESDLDDNEAARQTDHSESST